MLPSLVVTSRPCCLVPCVDQMQACDRPLGWQQAAPSKACNVW